MLWTVYSVHEQNCNGLSDSAATVQVTDFKLVLEDGSALCR
jgi:hypothetical protein